MKKDSMIIFRVDARMKNLIVGYANKVGCSVTDLLIECFLTSSVLKIEKVSNLDKQQFDELHQIGEEIRHCARMLDSIYKDLQKQKGINLIEENDNFYSILLEMRDIRKAMKAFIDSAKITENEYYSYLKKRDILPDISDYLMEQDPKFLKELKYRQMG